MSMTDKERIAKLEDALVKSHRSRPAVETGSNWDTRVMAQVRHESHRWCKEGASAIAQRFVWRFAAVVSGLALAFSVYGYSKGINPERLAVELLINDPLGIAAAHFDRM